MKISAKILLIVLLTGVTGLVGWRVSRPSDGEYGATRDEVSASPKVVTTNHLIHENSPYLLQHAHNPVNWYPWGEEAFAKAKREDKPIFLSVGYSTCHWCHVMARESFENTEIAAYLNEHFVSIKVDREQRPDVDKVYMTYVQATTGRGGWPMTVFLTPELKPFFGGTYYPPEDKWGRPGLKSLLRKIQGAWLVDRTNIESGASKAIEALTHFTQPEALVSLDHKMLDQAYEQISASFDAANGGFGGAPKFPIPVKLDYLLHFFSNAPESAQGKHALDMTLLTLRKMAAGGIHDQLGGGFHRYSVDASWQVPHFEKMLYNQAQLVGIYLSAYQITKESFYADTARDILDYVRRDMTSNEGGFYSAEDADSQKSSKSEEHGEGAFYIWDQGEIEQLLGSDAARRFSYCYGTTSDGNVVSDPQGEFVGMNILNVRHSVDETAQEFGRSRSVVFAELERSRMKLLRARSLRPRPLRDDKILTAWNGLMISAFARAGAMLDDQVYLETARRAAAFARDKLYQIPKHKLWRTYRNGTTEGAGFCDDYAFLVQGLLDLYEATFDVHWLQWARQLQVTQDTLFWDDEHGGYFSTTGQDSTVLLRLKESYDGAKPSPNSVSLVNLMRLANLFDDETMRDRAEKILVAFSGQLSRAPSASPLMLVGAEWVWKPAKQIIISGPLSADDTQLLLAELQRHYVPRKIVILADGGVGQDYFARDVPFFHEFDRDTRATAYVCEDYVCQLPTSEPERFGDLLNTPKLR